MTHHTSAYRILFDVAGARQKLGVRLDWMRLEAVFKECSSTLVSIVKIPDVVSAKVLQAIRYRVFLKWCQQEVNVVGHQHPGVY